MAAVRIGVILLPSHKLNRKQILGGCGIASVVKLPKHIAAGVLAESHVQKRVGRFDSTTTPKVRFVLRDMLTKMDLRSNGEGAGVVGRRKSSDTYQGYPLDYTPGQTNIFVLHILANNSSSAEQIGRTFQDARFEIARGASELGKRKTRQDLLTGNNLYEVTVIVNPDQEIEFVQLCNKINAIPSGPTIISADVNSTLYKGVGRADHLFDFFNKLGNRELVWALGHVRFPTNTPDGCLTAQPNWSITHDGRSSIVTYTSQNGEITNHRSIRGFLEGERFFPFGCLEQVPTHGAHGFSSMISESDGETLPHLVNYLLAKGLSSKEVVEVLSGERKTWLGRGMIGISGPVSVVAMTTKGLLAFRDERRLRPLVGGLAATDKDAYLLLASQPDAILYACRTNGIIPLSVWPVRNHFALGTGATYDDLASQMPHSPMGLCEKKVFDVRKRPNAVKVELDLRELRCEAEAMSDDQLFDLCRFPGDNGKFLDDRQTYIHRYIIRKIRQAVLGVLENAADAEKIDIRLNDMLGERHQTVGLINYLKKQMNLPSNLTVRWITDGCAGDNFGAFTSENTQIIHHGDSGDNTCETASGSDTTIHGSVGNSSAYACFGSTKLYVEKEAGDRFGTYMKGTSKNHPTLVVGESLGAFGGKSMHHGKILVLNTSNSKKVVGEGLGVGMEANARIFLRGKYTAEDLTLAEGLEVTEPSEAESRMIQANIREFCRRFNGYDQDELLSSDFTVIRKKQTETTQKRLIKYQGIPTFDKRMTKIIQLMANKGDGPVLLGKGMGAELPETPLNAAQVTAPGIDPREAQPLRHILHIPIGESYVQGHPIVDDSDELIGTKAVIVGGQSYGALGEKAWMSIYEATKGRGVLMCTGEGGFPPSLKNPDGHLIRQIASGRFGIKTDRPNGNGVDYFENAQYVEIKIGQGAKPAIGGLLPGDKITPEIASTREIDQGVSAISPPSHEDTYSIEDLKRLIELARIVAGEDVRVFVKVAATNDLESIVAGSVKDNANAINICGGDAGTGAATRESNLTGMSTMEAIHRAHKHLQKEGLRNYVDLIVNGGIFDAKGVIEAMSHGANTVELATAVNLSMGCVPCQDCHKGTCNKGITTSDNGHMVHLEENARQRASSYFGSLFLGIRTILQQNGINALPQATGNENLMMRKK